MYCTRALALIFRQLLSIYFNNRNDTACTHNYTYQLKFAAEDLKNPPRSASVFFFFLTQNRAEHSRLARPKTAPTLIYLYL